MQNSKVVAICLLLVGLTGCQCCLLTERYQDSIDYIADRRPHMDRLYCPAFDLTRIGYPDWCQCGFNRWLYGDCCCRDTRQQPPYIHNPFYVPPPDATSKQPLPPGQMIPPKSDVGPDSTGERDVPTQLKPTPDPLQIEKGDRLLPPPPAQAPPKPEPPPTLPNVK